MKLSIFFTALLPVAAVLAHPMVEERELDKRATSGTVLVDGLRYRTCPRTSCTAAGQYNKGAKISAVCYTTTSTTAVNGDWRWAKLSSGYWVAFGNGAYVSWSGSVSPC